MSTDVEALAARVERLTAAEKLRLAAGLLDKGRADMAEIVVDMVSTDLQALRLFGKVKRA